LIGELSLLAFSEAQFGSPALAIVRRLSALKAMRDYPGLRVWRCMGEGYRLGRRAADLPCADWEALLMRPLVDVRRELKIGVPRQYLSVQTAADCIDRRYREHLAAAA
jgi:ubiquinone biosynthesis protein COQ4